MRRTFFFLAAALLIFSGVWPTAHATEEPLRYFLDRPGMRPLPLLLTPEQAARFQGGSTEGYFLEPEGEFYATAVPNDSGYAEQTELTRIGAENLWDAETGSSAVVVAVIDSGVDLDHPDLVDNIWSNTDEIAGNNKDDDANGYVDDVNGWDFVSDTNDPTTKLDGSYVPGNNDGVNHGTLVAGVIGAVGNNAAGIAGVAWDVRLMPLRVLNSAGVGLTSSIITALDYARENGADVVNMSLVGSQYSSALDMTIQELVDDGIVVVAAAGNEGINLDANKRYPVCMSRVFGVGSVTANDGRSSFSNYGMSCTDIAAPGEGIYTTQALLDADGFSEAYGGGWAGTSLATPFVSGAAAVVKAAHPTWTEKQIVERIQEVAKGIGNAQLGAGRLALADLLSVAETQAPLEQILTAPGPGGGPDVRAFNLSGRKRKSILAYAPTYRRGVNVAAGDVLTGGQEEIITGTFAGGGPHVRVFDSNGAVRKQFFAYDAAFRGGVDVAAGDTDGNAVAEILTAPGPGGGPDVRIFNGDGVKRKSITAFAVSSRYGTHVAAGDVNGDGVDEIIAAQMAGAAPVVKVFSRSGEQLAEFFAYAPSFRGGVDVAAGDINGDGVAEILTAPGPGGGPQVRIFAMDGTVQGQFFAYAPSFRGGVRVAAGDVDGDTFEEIIVGPEGVGGPQVRAFNADGRAAGQFFAYAEGFHGGIDVGGGRVY